MWVWCSRGRGAGLAPEPLQPGRVAEVMERERLQGHVPAQRFLDRLVDDPHAARSDAAEQEVVAQALRASAAPRRSGLGLRPVAWPPPRAELFHDEQGGEERADPLGQLGMLVGVFGQRRPLAPAVSLQELLDQIVDRIESGRSARSWPQSSQSAGRAAPGSV